VEHSCHQCGAAVDDGVAFCRQCNAPQIRVVAPEAGVQPDIESEKKLDRPSGDAGASSPTAIQWSQALSAAVLALAIAAIFTVITLGPVGLGILIAGGLAVGLYRRRNPGANLTPRMGARLGAACGALGFGIVMVGLVVAVAGFHASEQVHQALLNAVQQAAARSSSPEAQQAVELFKTREGFTAMLILGSILTFLAFLLFSALGGALAALLLRRKDRF
jgi:hypothetical protein